MVHMMIVSIKGSRIETIPSSAGSSVRAEAWAIGAEPCPASLEYNPLFTPRSKAYAKVAPRKPPVAAEPVNASLKIEINEGRTLPMFGIMTANAPTK